jgi:NTP pyrophosphatase (non-canonical NTP hydrolase)
MIVDKYADYEDEKFISPEKPPEGLVAELLDCLVEELAEVIQRITKAKRFGLKETQLGCQDDNEARIVYELADVEAVIEMLHDENTLIAKQSEIDYMKKLKKTKLKRYLQSLNVHERDNSNETD